MDVSFSDSDDDEEQRSLVVSFDEDEKNIDEDEENKKEDEDEKVDKVEKEKEKEKINYTMHEGTMIELTGLMNLHEYEKFDEIARDIDVSKLEENMRWRFYYYWGIALLGMDEEGAVEKLKKSAGYNYCEPLYELCLIYRKKGKPREAYPFLSEAKKISRGELPDNYIWKHIYDYLIDYHLAMVSSFLVSPNNDENEEIRTNALDSCLYLLDYFKDEEIPKEIPSIIDDLKYVMKSYYKPLLLTTAPVPDCKFISYNKNVYLTIDIIDNHISITKRDDLLRPKAQFIISNLPASKSYHNFNLFNYHDHLAFTMMEKNENEEGESMYLVILEYYWLYYWNWHSVRKNITSMQYEIFYVHSSITKLNRSSYFLPNFYVTSLIPFIGYHQSGYLSRYCIGKNGGLGNLVKSSIVNHNGYYYCLYIGEDHWRFVRFQLGEDVIVEPSVNICYRYQTEIELVGSTPNGIVIFNDEYFIIPFDAIESLDYISYPLTSMDTTCEIIHYIGSHKKNKPLDTIQNMYSSSDVIFNNLNNISSLLSSPYTNQWRAMINGLSMEKNDPLSGFFIMDNIEKCRVIEDFGLMWANCKYYKGSGTGLIIFGYDCKDGCGKKNMVMKKQMEVVSIQNRKHLFFGFDKKDIVGIWAYWINSKYALQLISSYDPSSTTSIVDWLLQPSSFNYLFTNPILIEKSSY